MLIYKLTVKTLIEAAEIKPGFAPEYAPVAGPLGWSASVGPEALADARILSAVFNRAGEIIARQYVERLSKEATDGTDD